MRLLLMYALSAAAMSACVVSVGHTQSAKAPAGDVRYFTSLGDLMGERAVDAFIKETRQSGKVVAATLDACYSVSPTSDRKDRFNIELKIDGQKISGSGQSLEAKSPVTVEFTRKLVDKAMTFEGKITVDGVVSAFSSADNTDISPKEFEESQAVEDEIEEKPADFTQVSPQSIAVKVERNAFVNLVKSLRSENVQLALDSIAVDCNALRSGFQTARLTIDPARAAGLIAKLKSMPGVTAVGWTTGPYDMDRAIRFSAAGWRDGTGLDRDKLATTILNAAAKGFAATPSSSKWNATTGELTFSVKRPSLIEPGLDLTETLEMTALVAAEKPGTTDQLVIWLGASSSTTTDEMAGPHLEFADAAANTEEAVSYDDDHVVKALATELKGQQWDADKPGWK